MSRVDYAVIAIAITAIASLYAWFWNGDEGEWLEVAVSGKVIARLDLQQEQDFFVDGLLGKSQIHIADGGAAFVNSPCPAKLCIRTGHIHHPGETAACLPNAVSLHVVSSESLFDAVNF